MAITSKRKEIEDRLYTVLSGAGAGNVLHGQYRLTDPEDFLNLMTENPQNKKAGDRGERIIKGWEFYRSSVEQTRLGARRIPAVATNHTGVIHTYKLDGIYGYDMSTGSYDKFNEMVDLMLNTLGDTIRVHTDAGYDLRITAPTAELSVEEFGVGGIQVHTVDITFMMEEDLVRT